MADMQPNNFQQSLGHCGHPTALIICFLGNVIQIHHVGASKNRGTPKSSILIGFSIINHPFWGTPIFGNTHVTEILLFFGNCFLPPNHVYGVSTGSVQDRSTFLFIWAIGKCTPTDFERFNLPCRWLPLSCQKCNELVNWETCLNEIVVKRKHATCKSQTCF